MDGLKAIMYHNGENSTFTVKENGVDKKVTVSGANQTLNITKNDEEKLRLVVCTGNVKIEDGVHFKGHNGKGDTDTWYWCNLGIFSD